jgi:membrane-bound lytic murein transglycosylase D
LGKLLALSWGMAQLRDLFSRRSGWHLSVLLCLGLGGPALGALDSAGTWSTEGAVQAPAALESASAAPWSLWQTSITPESLDLLARDAEQRLPEEFKVPVGLEKQVQFWLEIYTRYSSREVLIFDENHPDVVYEVIDFRNLARTSRNRAAYEIVSRQVLRDRVAAYQRAFLSLSSRKRSQKRRSREENQVLAATRGLPHSHSWAELKKGLRVQWGQRDQVILGLQSSAPYRVRMEHVFTSMGLPGELTLLSLVESSFNPRAVSHAGAAGVWQFMPDSGAEFLLVRGERGIDERISAIKSTVAAARLLQRNQKMLGSWPAAISAYNHGHGKWLPVSSRDRSSPGRILAQCSKSKHLPTKLGFASRNYYAEFLALLRADKYQDRAYGPRLPVSGQPVRFVEVAEDSKVESLAELHGLAPGALMALNPDILAAKWRVPAGFLLAIPSNQDDFAKIIRATRERERSFRTARSGPRAGRRGSLQAASGGVSSRRPRG